MGIGSFIWYFTEYFCYLSIIGYVVLNLADRFKIDLKTISNALIERIRSVKNKEPIVPNNENSTVNDIKSD
jgi:pyruvate-formate lyase-activating enzyme